MNTRVNAIREISMMMGEISNAIILNGKHNNPIDILTSMGYKKDGNTYTKKGISFVVDIYHSSYEYSVSWGFYYGDHKWCNFYDIETRIDDILSSGFKPNYSRSVELEQTMETIKNKILKTNNIVKNYYGYNLGDYLRIFGYFVIIDGSSICTFTKGCIRYIANFENGKWKLSDSYEIYITNGRVSRPFSLYKKTKFDDFAECIISNLTTFGRRQMEKDLLPTYTKFRVRTYLNKYLETIKWFDNFDDAKEYAYKLAKDKASKVENGYKRYAHTEPKDESEKYDMLACYCWYGEQHLVFVQGEN